MSRTPSHPVAAPHSSRPVIAPLPEERRALEMLSPRSAWCRCVGTTWIVVARKKGVSLRVGSVPGIVIDVLRQRRWIAPQDAGDALFITDTGRKALAIKSSGGGGSAPHRMLEAITLDDGETCLFNRDESPLSRLARVKKHDGSPLIDAASVAAGERLAADIMRAGMMPGITMRWDATGSSGDHRASPTDLMIAARQRVEAALDSAGHDLAGLLLDVLAFSKGVEDIERERRWPQRSAKIIIALALSRLAAHYGFATTARGADHVRSTAWQADGAKPVIW